MDKNLYTKAVDEIKVSDKAVKNAIATVKENERSQKVLDMKTYSKNHKLTKVAAAAVAAALVLSCGAYTLFDRSPSEGSGFILTAGAAEINSNTFTPISEISQACTFSLSENTYYEEFNILLKCEGKNIKSITYTANGDATLYVNNSADLLLDSEAYDKKDGYLYRDDSPACASITVDYNNQFTAIEPDYNVSNYPVYTPVSMVLAITDDYGDEVKELLRNHFYYQMYYQKVNRDYDEYTRHMFAEAEQRGFDYETFDYEAMYTSLYDNLFNYASMDVTVTYNDGSTETKTVLFDYEFSGKDDANLGLRKIDKLTITAKLAD